ncbi:MAG: hypothetical protein R8G66_24095 [Cytophagales bacterium]|nr:hypothetical protein [Cytophagales bacterium]
MFRKVAYWSALVISVLFVCTTMILLVATYVDIKAHSENINKLLPTLTLFISAIGTFSTVFFGWRIDRRQSKELELKIKELEAKYDSELKLKRDK